MADIYFTFHDNQKILNMYMITAFKINRNSCHTSGRKPMLREEIYFNTAATSSLFAATKKNYQVFSNFQTKYNLTQVVSPNK